MFDFQKKHYEEKGWAIFNSVFTRQEMNEVRALIWKAFRESPEKNIQWFNHIYPALLFSPSGIINSYRKDSRMVEIAKSFLGENILELNNQSYFRLPGDVDERVEQLVKEAGFKEAWSVDQGNGSTFQQKRRYWA